MKDFDPKRLMLIQFGLGMLLFVVGFTYHLFSVHVAIYNNAIMLFALLTLFLLLLFNPEKEELFVLDGALMMIIGFVIMYATPEDSDSVAGVCGVAQVLLGVFIMAESLKVRER